MTTLADLPKYTRAMVLYGNLCADMNDEPFPRMIRTALSDWMVYSDETVEMIQGGDGAMTPPVDWS